MSVVVGEESTNLYLQTSAKNSHFSNGDGLPQLWVTTASYGVGLGLECSIG